MTSPLLTVFFPLYNEQDILEQTIRMTHDYLEQRSIDHEIIAVDNGSVDQTADIGRRLSAHYPWFRFDSLPQRGAGRAFAHGVRQAKGSIFIALDADLSSDLIFIDYALDLLKYSEMVVGSKTMGDQRRTAVRIFGSQLYILCTQLLLNLTISDYSIGSKAYQRAEIIEYMDRLDSWTGHTLELAVYLKKRGKRIVQIGINCDDKRKSHFNLLHEGWYRYLHLFKVWRKAGSGAIG